jgi:hypothetical protein
LKNAEAAEQLGVDVRTLKRWTARPRTREALGAILHGKQWRIPLPENLSLWRGAVRKRLGGLGVNLEPSWRRHLRRVARKSVPYVTESYRLWLAALFKVLAHEPITDGARRAIGVLQQAACGVLKRLPRPDMEAGSHKSAFPAQLRLHGLTEDQVQAVMGYWPEREHFELVRSAHTFKELEKIRRKLDYWQATHELEQRGEQPTAENIAPLLHKDVTAHINDTRERMPEGVVVVRHPPLDQMRRMTLASVHASKAGKKWPLVVIDWRLPQTGLAKRTVQKRHPQRQKEQRAIRAEVLGVRATAGAEEGTVTGMTPIRKPTSNHPQASDRDSFP